jgi:hypothetical protein
MQFSVNQFQDLPSWVCICPLTPQFCTTLRSAWLWRPCKQRGFLNRSA